VIIALSIGYAIWADSDRRPDAELRARLTLPLLVTCVGFSVWLAAAELEPNWTTLVIFLIMLAALLRALMYAMDQRQAIRAWSPLAGGAAVGHPRPVYRLEQRGSLAQPDHRSDR
jgi:hypothetical protein